MVLQQELHQEQVLRQVAQGGPNHGHGTSNQ